MKKIIRSICVTPDIWNLAIEQSKRKNRSISNYIEYLILMDKENKNDKKGTTASQIHDAPCF